MKELRVILKDITKGVRASSSESSEVWKGRKEDSRYKVKVLEVPVSCLRASVLRLRLREEMFLVDAGPGTPKICMQDELTGVPINQATRFENKVGSLNVVAGESLIKKRILERFFIDLVAGQSLIKERAAARFHDFVGSLDVAAGEPLLLPRRFRQNRAWMELKKIWRTNKKIWIDGHETSLGMAVHSYGSCQAREMTMTQDEWWGENKAPQLLSKRRMKFHRRSPLGAESFTSALSLVGGKKPVISVLDVPPSKDLWTFKEEAVGIPLFETEIVSSALGRNQIHPLYKFFYPLFKPFFEQGELFSFPTHSSDLLSFLSASRLTSSCTAFTWTSRKLTFSALSIRRGSPFSTPILIHCNIALYLIVAFSRTSLGLAGFFTKDSLARVKYLSSAILPGSVVVAAWAWIRKIAILLIFLPHLPCALKMVFQHNEFLFSGLGTGKKNESRLGPRLTAFCA
ncbi:ribosomal protein S1 [Canna indica]|uniref:Ribosomal protein S1 (Mitochondrion) n=1 Tax=Canna indica TaxID=4628 RepID=A0AAQ3KM61_9LILI|nr:ribosomal protein S1 [Canna indica]